MFMSRTILKVECGDAAELVATFFPSEDPAVRANYVGNLFISILKEKTSDSGDILPLVRLLLQAPNVSYQLSRGRFESGANPVPIEHMQELENVLFRSQSQFWRNCIVDGIIAKLEVYGRLRKVKERIVPKNISITVRGADTKPWMDSAYWTGDNKEAMAAQFEEFLEAAGLLDVDHWDLLVGDASRCGRGLTNERWKPFWFQYYLSF